MVESKENENKNLCNCREKIKCPLLKRCKIASVVYKATVNLNNEEYTYIGSTHDFKMRYSNHKTSFVKKKVEDQPQSFQVLCGTMNLGTYQIYSGKY